MPLADRGQRVAVEVGGTLLELREVLDGLEGALRAEEPLNVDAAKARRIDAAAVLLRADVPGQVRRRGRVSVHMAVEAGHAQARHQRLAIERGVELLLRELRHQQPDPFQVLRVQDAVEHLVVGFDGQHLTLGHVAEVRTAW